VGLTAENVERGLVHRAPLQQGLPRDDDLDFLIGGHDAADGGGQWCDGGRPDGGALAAAMASRGGEGLLILVNIVI
jgi:hypothetical protein